MKIFKWVIAFVILNIAAAILWLWTPAPQKPE